MSNFTGDGNGNSLGPGTLFGGNDPDSILGNGGNDSLYGGAGNDTLFGGADNDSLFGGADNDSLSGDAGADTLSGDAGSDSLSGGLGNDSLFGGADVDYADYSNLTTAINANLSGGTDSVTGTDVGTDTLSLIEGVIGGSGNDSMSGGNAGEIFIGNGGADSLFGGSGNDSLFGGSGTDTLSGGNDSDLLEGGANGDSISGGGGGGGARDTVSYAGSTNAVNVTINSTTANTGGDAEGDSLTGIEDLIGSGLDDTLTGDVNANSIEGGAGNDRIIGGDGTDTLYGGSGQDSLYGGAGSESLFGGADFDFAVYTSNTAGFTANLAATPDTVNAEGTDTLSGIEGVIGGSGADSMSGDSLGNIFIGNQGNDTLLGNDGDDSLYGGVGADRLYGGNNNDYLEGGSEGDSLFGGDGTDTASYASSTAAVNVTINGSANTGGDAAGDTLNSIENLTGSIYNDTLAGDSLANVIDGGSGADSISALGGNDTVYGGGGSDSIFGGDGNDSIDAGPGSDTVDGGNGDDLIYGGSSGPVTTDYILNGSFTGGGTNWSGTDLEFNPESAYGVGGSNGVAEIDGNAGQITQMNQSFVVGGASTGQLSFRGIVRVDGDVGVDGYRVDVLDASNTVIATLNVIPPSNSVWTSYTLPVNFPAGGTYTLRFTELGDNESLGALVDDVQLTATTTGVDGADSLSGGAGNDTIFGGAANDTILGGTGVDSLSGDDGNDSLIGGAGDDTQFGGAGNDRFLVLEGGVDSVAGAESIFGGGNVGEDTLSDLDTIDVSDYGWGRVQIVYTSTNPLDLEGTITLYDIDGTTVLGTIQFDDIEDIIVCFTPGTMILTDQGEVAVEALQPGDLVMTRDNGLQPLRWVGQRHISALQLQANPDLQPVRIARGALGGQGPDRTMLVSPQHRLLIEGGRAELLFGEAEVLVPAKHLIGHAEVTRALPQDGVTYIHILFDRHEIVQSDGIWTESFQPAERTLNALDQAVRQELLALFPQLEADAGSYTGVRLSLKAHEAQVLLAG